MCLFVITDDELSLGAEAKSLSRAGSEGGYSSFSPRLSPMILENSEPPEFPIWQVISFFVSCLSSLS